MSTTLGRLKQLGAVVIAIAIVLAAGTVVGQAPELFGAEVADDPEASIAFPDQTGNATAITVENVTLSEGGFVVVTGGDDEILGVSDHLEAGSHENVTVTGDGDGDGELLGRLTATVYQDETGDGTFVREAAEGEQQDRPYVEDGHPVSDTATVTMDERDGGETNGSFLVESVDAPASATVNGTVNVTTEVSNPNDFETRQHVEVRLDGAVMERQVLSLEGGETGEHTVEVDLGGVDPGTYVYGVYTTDDGAVDEIAVEDDGPAAIDVVEADTGGVVVDASLPAGGFVGVENENGTVLGASAELGPGDHDNVTVGFDDGPEPGDEVTVVALRNDPDGEESAPYLADEQPVAATATIEETEIRNEDEE